MKPLSIEVSPGELIDRLTILEIKLERVSPLKKRENIDLELRRLHATFDESLQLSEALKMLIDELKAINEKLWDIEDELRGCERRQEFGAEFVALARSVYRMNDRRSELKLAINVLLGSQLIEEKYYRKY